MVYRTSKSEVYIKSYASRRDKKKMHEVSKLPVTTSPAGLVATSQVRGILAATSLRGLVAAGASKFEFFMYFQQFFKDF